MSRSAAEQPLALRVRPDLSARLMPLGQKAYWCVQDPVSLRSYQLKPEEYFILQNVNGRRSLQQIKERFERRFAPRRLMLSHMQAFLGMLHRENLLIAEVAEQGDVLLRRRDEIRSQAIRQALSNPLAIRLPGIPSDRLLSRLLPYVAWMFSPFFLTALGLLGFSALLLLTSQWQELLEEIAQLPQRFATDYGLFLLGALVVSKVLHELGHALTCKRLGASCHEMGVMFLVFMPCLYCNVSDAGSLPQKWQRMAVTAAGVGVELVLAAACLWGWFLTSPGFLHSFCLAMTVICSVNTLLINGNPLLRFDGYYLLADYVGIPNLAQTAGTACRQFRQRIFGGNAVANEAVSGWLVVYGFLSSAYRWFVLVVILLALHRTLSAYGLSFLAWTLGCLVLVTGVFGPWYRQSMQRASERGSLGTRFGALLVIGGMLCTGLLLPIQRTTKVAVRIEAKDVQRVYVTVPGRITAHVKEYAHVKEGQPLASLTNLKLTAEVTSMQRQVAEQQAHVNSLTQLRSVDDRAEAELAGAEAILRDLRNQLQLGETRRSQQELVAPRDGVVLPPRRRETRTTPGRLVDWRGTPLEPRNLGSYLEEGTWVCTIGDPKCLEAIAVVTQEQVARISVGQSVSVRLNALPYDELHGTVAELERVDPTEDDFSDRDSSAAEGDVAGFRARIAVQETDLPVRIGSRGQANIVVTAESTAVLCYRYLRRTFAIFL